MSLLKNKQAVQNNLNMFKDKPSINIYDFDYETKNERKMLFFSDNNNGNERSRLSLYLLRKNMWINDKEDSMVDYDEDCYESIDENEDDYQSDIDVDINYNFNSLLDKDVLSKNENEYECESRMYVDNDNSLNKSYVKGEENDINGKGNNEESKINISYRRSLRERKSGNKNNLNESDVKISKFLIESSDEQENNKNSDDESSVVSSMERLIKHKNNSKNNDNNLYSDNEEIEEQQTSESDYETSKKKKRRSSRVGTDEGNKKVIYKTERNVDESKLVEMVKAKLPWTQMARHFSVSDKSVLNYWRKISYKYPELATAKRPSIGKINEVEFVKLVKQNESWSNLSEKFGVSQYGARRYWQTINHKYPEIHKDFAIKGKCILNEDAVIEMIKNDFSWNEISLKFKVNRNDILNFWDKVSFKYPELKDKEPSLRRLISNEVPENEFVELVKQGLSWTSIGKKIKFADSSVIYHWNKISHKYPEIIPNRYGHPFEELDEDRLVEMIKQNSSLSEISQTFNVTKRVIEKNWNKISHKYPEITFGNTSSRESFNVPQTRSRRISRQIL